MGPVHRPPHHKDLTCVVYRVRFNKHYSGGQRGCAVQISHTCLFCPDKGAISRRACRAPNNSTLAVNAKRSAGASTGEHPYVLHSSCLSSEKSPQATRTSREPIDSPSVL